MPVDVDAIRQWRDNEDPPVKWPEIGKRLGVHPDAARSAYRRANVTSEAVSYDLGGDAQLNDRFVSHQIEARRVKVAFPTDLHCPYHDEYALDLALQLIYEFEPSVLACGSDGVDFYGLSVFDKDPNRKEDIYSEIKVWHSVQRKLNDAAAGAKRIFIIGNHEDRLRRHNWRRNPYLASHPSMQLEGIMELEKVNIVHPPAHEIVINNVLCVKHGNRVSQYSAYTAKAELLDERYALNTMTGHVHRGGTHFATTRGGIVRADECFCLCSVYPEYTQRPNWQQGIVLATVIGTQVYTESIPFFGEGADKVAFWRGRQYTI